MGIDPDLFAATHIYFVFTVELRSVITPPPAVADLLGGKWKCSNFFLIARILIMIPARNARFKIP